MNQIKEYSETTFESIKHVNELGIEFWYARELMQALEYSRWRNFEKVIEKAKLACKLSENLISDHFADVSKMVSIGSNTQRKQDDYELSRYACYLIVQNADSRKQVVAFGQTYFAVQTEAKLKNENISNEHDANIAHHEVGKAVRDTIKRLGGTMPEDLPTPEKSIAQIEKEELQKLETK